MDIVHLDDNFVMFASGTVRMGSAKIPQINIIAGNGPNRPVFNQQAPVYYRPNGNQERCMNKSAIRLVTLAIYAMALIAVPLTTAYAAGGDNPSPPRSEEHTSE